MRIIGAPGEALPFSDNYFEDPKQRSLFQQWLNELWEQKDQQLTQFHQTD